MSQSFEALHAMTADEWPAAAVAAAAAAAAASGVVVGKRPLKLDNATGVERRTTDNDIAKPNVVGGT
jgi:hypothetical protein